MDGLLQSETILHKLTHAYQQLCERSDTDFSSQAWFIDSLRLASGVIAHHQAYNRSYLLAALTFHQQLYPCLPDDASGADGREWMAQTINTNLMNCMVCVSLLLLWLLQILSNLQTSKLMLLKPGIHESPCHEPGFSLAFFRVC